MIRSLRHLHAREVRFLGLIAVTLMLIALHLGSGLRLAALGGTGWRALDLAALERRIESGELSDREAAWNHLATADEAAVARGAP